MSQTMREALMSLARREDTNLTWSDRFLIGKVIAALSSPSSEQAQQGTDDYKAWYEEAMVASNAAGCVGMSAADTIRYLDSELASRPAAAAPAGGVTEEEAQGLDIDPKQTVGQLAERVGAWETPEGFISFGSWMALAAFHHHALKGAARQWQQIESTKWTIGGEPVETVRQALRGLSAAMGGDGEEILTEVIAQAQQLIASRPAAAAPAAQAYMCQETETPCTRCTSTCEAALAGAAQGAEPVAGLRINTPASGLRPWPDHELQLFAAAKTLPEGFYRLVLAGPSQPPAAQGAEPNALRGAIEEIAAMEYDKWSNGARAGEIARNALAMQSQSIPVTGSTVADRLDAMADREQAGSQAASDLYAAATVWRKHLKAGAAQGAKPVIYVDNTGKLISRVSAEQVEAVLGPVVDAIRAASPQPPTGTEKKDGQQAIHQGMTIAGDGAAMLGRLMREQRASHLGVYPDGNPNAGTEKKA